MTAIAPHPRGTLELQSDRQLRSWSTGMWSGASVCAVIGATSLALGAMLGAMLDRLIDETVTPQAGGFVVSAVSALLIVLWAERGELFRPLRLP